MAQSAECLFPARGNGKACFCREVVVDEVNLQIAFRFCQLSLPSGKTRAGAEFIRFGMGTGLFGRVALVGPTLGDVREVMIEGVSGLRSITDCYAYYPTYSPSRRRLEYPNGAVATVFSAEDADSLRGPQFDAAWCDEIAAWPDGEAVWDTLQMGIRLGRSPVCVATTTPRPVPLVRRLVAREALVSRMRTADNAEHLADGFLEQMQRVYGSSALARQELDGGSVRSARPAR
ncbi:MAG: terminase family protein [Pseudomonadota bacterium]